MSKPINYSNPYRLRILSLVRENPNISHREIADIVGISQTGVRHHLFQLENEGVITLAHKRGRKTVKKARKPVDSEKLTEYAKLGRGKNAFVPRKTKKRDKLQERIDMVVAKAQGSENNTQHDVIRHVNARLRLTNSTKIG